MNDRARVALVVVGLAALLGIAGCLSPVSDQELAENATYDWETDANATYRIYTTNYTAVLRLQNRTSVELALDTGLGSTRPVQISALQFRYPNGTVVNASAFSVSAGQRRVRIEPPAPNGTMAFTAARSGPNFRTPVVVNGSHEVQLPPGREITIPVVSRVVPGNFSTETVDNRVHVRWTAVDRDAISVKFYRGRDVLLFGAVAGVVLAIGAVGLVYYRREISKLEAQREELGLDVDQEDDDPRDRGPPPGMG